MSASVNSMQCLPFNNFDEERIDSMITEHKIVFDYDQSHGLLESNNDYLGVANITHGLFKQFNCFIVIEVATLNVTNWLLFSFLSLSLCTVLLFLVYFSLPCVNSDSLLYSYIC